MTRKIIFTPQAQNDFEEIYYYIALDNPEKAIEFLNLLHERIRILLEVPELGIKKDSLKKGLRCIYLGNYSIFYTVKMKNILIVRVLHGARDTGNLF